MSDTVENGRIGNVEKLTLENFSKETGRHLTPFFAGRKDMIQVAMDRRDQVFRKVEAGKPEPAEGVTLLFQGAPGAGKTSLLSKIRQNLGVPCITLEVKDLAAPDIMLKKIERALETAGIPDAPRRMMDALGAISVSVLGGKISLDPSRLLEAVGMVTKGGTIAVFIDEIQNLDPGNGQAVDCLRTLHEGKHGLPILPVLAGLGNSPIILNKAGISRIEPLKGVPVGLLTPDEARESVGSFMKYFKVRGNVGSWIESVASRSDLWPQHLHNGLRALAEGLVKTDADIDRIDGKRVEALQDGYRMESYNARLTSMEIQNAIYLVAELVDGIPEWGMMRISIRKTIIGRGRPLDDPDGEGYWVSKDTDGFLDHLVHEGILQDDGKGMYRCPIPSLRAFLSGNFRSEPPRLEDMRDRTLALQNPTEITDPSPFKDTFG